MHVLLKTHLFVTFIGIATASSAASASNESLTTLINQTGLQQHLASASKDLEARLQQMISQVPVKLTEAQKQALDKATPQIAEAVRTELSWSQWQPMILKTYQNSLSQEEVNQLLALYKTPGYRALAQKMHMVNNATDQLIAQRLPQIIQKVVPMIDKAVGSAGPGAAMKDKSSKSPAVSTTAPTTPIFNRP